MGAGEKKGFREDNERNEFHRLLLSLHLNISSLIKEKISKTSSQHCKFTAQSVTEMKTHSNSSVGICDIKYCSKINHEFHRSYYSISDSL